VGVDGVVGETPSLDLLCDALGMGWGKNTELGGGAERRREIIEESRDSVGEAGGSENAGAEKRVAGESVEKGVIGAFNVGMDPVDVRELFDGKSANRTLLTMSYPF
jgi:hypothetical protein